MKNRDRNNAVETVLMFVVWAVGMIALYMAGA